MSEQRGSWREESSQLSATEDRRASIRLTSNLEATSRLVLPGQAGCWEVRVRDLSTLGIGLLFPHRLDSGTVLEIELNTRSIVRTLQARVVHVEPEANGDWIVGCAFISELDDTEMRLFHAERILSTPADCRRWVRFPCNVETVCYTCETVPGERAPARVLNISAGGIGLLLPCQFTAGTLLHFELPGPLERPTRKMLVRVVRAIEHANGDWFLGCEFAARLNEEELRSLTG